MPLPKTPTDYEADVAGLERSEFARANCFVRRTVLVALGGFEPRYTDVVAEISEFFRQQYARAIGLNIDPMAIAFDPGIGFGKTLEHNLELLAHLEQLRTHDRALVVGVSRKSFLGKLIGSPNIGDRLVPGLALTSLLRARGADVFRVHDVKENVYALRVSEAVLQRAK